MVGAAIPYWTRTIGLEHTLMMAHSLLQDLLLGTHFQPTPGTFTHTLLSVAT